MAGMGLHLKLRDVRAAFRLIGEVRELGDDPAKWRPHMVRRLRTMFRAEVVVSSEVHVRANGSTDGSLRVIDVGWGCDGSDGDHVWRIQSESDAPPDTFMLAVTAGAAPDATAPVPVRPTVPVRGGTTFVLSQYPLAHLGAIDQLGLHRGFEDGPFNPADHRLARLFHVELGRLWRRDALRKATDPLSDLPPRLAQTLVALQAGCSEKEVSTRLGISAHTVHNYVKALHQRYGVASRGELLAKAPKPAAGFVPKFSVT
jgi:DNA-binding CsgD family transcriptional regulator